MSVTPRSSPQGRFETSPYETFKVVARAPRYVSCSRGPTHQDSRSSPERREEAMNKRYPQTVLVSCEAPWDENGELIEAVFRDEVRSAISSGFRDLYIFGTAGEGYAVTLTQVQGDCRDLPGGDAWRRRAADGGRDRDVDGAGGGEGGRGARHRVPDVPDRAAAVGGVDRRRVHDVFHRRLRQLPRLGLSALQPAGARSGCS